MNPSGKILGQLAVMQSMASLLPDLKSMISFISRGLLDIPGVSSVTHSAPEDETGKPPRDQPPPEIVTLKVQARNWLHARLFLLISDKNAFMTYKPFLENMAGTLGLVLEERRQRELHQHLSEELDKTVQERTIELRASEEHLRITLNSIGDAVISTNMEGVITDINPAAEDLTGWLMADAFGKPLSEIMHIINRTTRAEAANPVEKVLQSGHVVEIANHTMLIRRDGTEIQIADSAAPILDANGAIKGVVLVFRDVTKEYQLMDAAQRSQKLEALGILAGGIAHEFNNLLSRIFGNIEMALDDLHGPDAASCLHSALNAMTRARALTHQLLTFSKGGTPVRKVQQLNELLRKTLQSASSESSIALKTEIPDDLWPCSIDKHQIVQVIDNIVINSKEAMPNGGTLTLKAENILIEDENHPLLKQGRFVKITASDTGSGIHQDILPKIFDPFFTTKEKGNGLGLSACYSIITKHSGCILAESEPEKGTAFTIYLLAAPSPESVTEPSKQTDQEHTGKGRVIVMDDQEFIRKNLSRMLSSLGYIPIAFNDGKEAAEWFRKEIEAGRRITAAILDLTVPGGIGGAAAVRAMRKVCTKTPIFVSSGYSTDPIMSNPSEYQFTDSIDKPFLKTDLANMLNKFI